MQMLMAQQPVDLVARHRQADEQIQRFGSEQSRLVGEQQGEFAQRCAYEVTLLAVRKTSACVYVGNIL